MRKLIIIGVLAALLLAGCTVPEAYTASVSDVTEETIMSETTTTAEPTTTTAQETTTAATTEATTTTATPKIAARAETAIALVAPQEPKTIQINVETEFGNKKLTFTEVETRPEENIVIFKFALSDSKSAMPVSGQTFLFGLSGTKYKTNTFWQTGNKGDVRFNNIADYTDLSHVTLTYAFEGYDPVTVEIDIPGL